jgi:hypothetical protein
MNKANLERMKANYSCLNCEHSFMAGRGAQRSFPEEPFRAADRKHPEQRGVGHACTYAEQVCALRFFMFR